MNTRPDKRIERAIAARESVRGTADEIAAAIAGARSAGSLLMAGVEALRERIAALRAEQKTVTRRPVERAVAEQRIDAWFEKRAAIARKHVRPPADYTRPAYEPARAVENTDLLFAALAPQIATATKAGLDTVYAEAAGIGDAQRAALLAELDARILATEREEESIIRQAEEVGIAIQRRADADPRATLADAEDLP